MTERRGMAIQSAEHDAVVAAIEEYGRACYVGMNATPARKALNKAIDDWATARDAAIRAEERAACAQICQDHGEWCMKEAQAGGDWGYLVKRKDAVLFMAEKIRARSSQPEPAKEATCQPAQNTDATQSTGRYAAPAKPSKP